MLTDAQFTIHAIAHNVQRCTTLVQPGQPGTTKQHNQTNQATKHN